MNRQTVRYIGYAVLAGLLLVMFWNVFRMLEIKWAESESYYSHGYLIPLVSAVLIWRLRDTLAEIPAKSSNFGLVVLCFGLVMRLVGALRAVNFVNGFAFIVVLTGLVLFMFGRRITLKLLFPLLFLVAMVPLPDVAIIDISFELKTFATELSEFFIPYLGIVLLRDQSTFHFWGMSGGYDHLTIADVCSGLRSMIALLAFGAIFAYIAKTTMRRRLEMFAASIPCSIVANMSRIVLITVVAYIWGSEVATVREYVPNPFGKDAFTIHDLTGLMIYVVAFIGFFTYDKMLNRPPFRLPRRRGAKLWLLDYDGMLLKLADNQLECLVKAGWLAPTHQVRRLNEARWMPMSDLEVFEDSPRKRLLEFNGRQFTFDECVELVRNGQIKKDDFVSFAGSRALMRAGSVDFVRGSWPLDATQRVCSFVLYAVMPIISLLLVWRVPNLRSFARGTLGVVLLSVVLWFGVRLVLLLVAIVAEKLDVTEKPLPIPAATADSSTGGE